MRLAAFWNGGNNEVSGCSPIALCNIRLNFGYELDYPGDYIAQTFTVRHSGQLTGVGVQVSLWGYSNYKPVTDDLTVSLMRTDSSGIPSIHEVLASRTISRNLVPHRMDDNPMLEVDLSDTNLNVRAGEALAIALSSNHTYYAYPRDYMGYVWHTGLWNPHPRGEFYIYSPTLYGPAPHLVSDSYEPPKNTRDMGFRVLIRIPVPGSLACVQCRIGV